MNWADLNTPAAYALALAVVGLLTLALRVVYRLKTGQDITRNQLQDIHILVNSNLETLKAQLTDAVHEVNQLKTDRALVGAGIATAAGLPALAAVASSPPPPPPLDPPPAFSPPPGPPHV